MNFFSFEIYKIKIIFQRSSCVDNNSIFISCDEEDKMFLNLETETHISTSYPQNHPSPSIHLVSCIEGRRRRQPLQRMGGRRDAGIQ